MAIPDPHPYLNQTFFESRNPGAGYYPRDMEMSARIDAMLAAGSGGGLTLADVQAEIEAQLALSDDDKYLGFVAASTSWPAGNKNEWFIFDTAGVVDGEAVEAGVAYVCTTDGTAAGTPASWTIDESRSLPTSGNGSAAERDAAGPWVMDWVVTEPDADAGVYFRDSTGVWVEVAGGDGRLKSLVPIADADVNADHPETETLAEIESAIAALNAATPDSIAVDDVVKYTTPAGLIHYYDTFDNAGAIAVLRLDDDENEYKSASLPVPAEATIASGNAQLAAGSYFRVIDEADDYKISRFKVGPTGAYISAPFEGGGGSSSANLIHNMTHAEMLASPTTTVIAFITDDDANRGWWYRDPVDGWEKDQATAPASGEQTLFFPIEGDGTLVNFTIDHGLSVIHDFHIRLKSPIEKRGVNIVAGAGTTLVVGPFATAPADNTVYELVVTGIL